jgi:hypothetical protein
MKARWFLLFSETSYEGKITIRSPYLVNIRNILFLFLLLINLFLKVYPQQIVYLMKNF